MSLESMLDAIVRPLRYPGVELFAFFDILVYTVPGEKQMKEERKQDRGILISTTMKIVNIV